MASPAECRARDLACGSRAIVLWYLPAVALFVPVSTDVTRAWIWTTALTVMGVACLVNARRCGRLHCYVTGPVFLAGAGLSLLHGLGSPLLSWDWTGGLILAGWVAGHAIESVRGRYALNHGG